MDKNKLAIHIEQSTKKLIELTSQLCFNELSPSIKYTLVANSTSFDDYLTSEEKDWLSQMIKLKDKTVSATELEYILYHDGKVPLWINIEVNELIYNNTVVQLLCSRRLRTNDELNYRADAYPPFHILVPTPPGYTGQKFDINWKRNRDNEQEMVKRREIRLTNALWIIYPILLIIPGIIFFNLKDTAQLYALAFSILILILGLAKKPMLFNLGFQIILALILFANYATLVHGIVGIIDPNRGISVGNDGSKHHVMDMTWILDLLFAFILTPATISLFNKKVVKTLNSEIIMILLLIITITLSCFLSN